MKLKEIFHFDSKDYQKSSSSYTDEELVKNIHRERRQSVASRWTIGVNSALLGFGHGLACIGVGLGLRKLAVADAKLTILEKEWKDRGNPPVEEDVVGDIIAPIVVCAVATGVTTGVGAELDGHGLHAMLDAGLQGAETLASAAVHGQGLPPGSSELLGDAIVDGAEQTLTGFDSPLPVHASCHLSTSDAVRAVGQAAGAEIPVKVSCLAVDYAMDPTRSYQKTPGTPTGTRTRTKKS